MTGGPDLNIVAFVARVPHPHESRVYEIMRILVGTLMAMTKLQEIDSRNHHITASAGRYLRVMLLQRLLSGIIVLREYEYLFVNFT